MVYFFKLCKSNNEINTTVFTAYNSPGSLCTK